MKFAYALLVAMAVLVMGPSCLGLRCLEQPQNVTVNIVDTNITLKWFWDNPCGLNVTFSAQYHGDPDDEGINHESLSLIPECQNIRIRQCDLSSAISDYLQFYNVSIRANAGGSHSPWTSLIFSPHVKAQIGPPGVHLESVHGGDMKIIISNPEANRGRKIWELDSLNYKLTIWKKSSYLEEKNQDIFSGEIIHNLEPDTVYCVKVKAHLVDHIGLYSPDTCVRTPKAWNGLPRPKNLQVDALNMKCILHWDNIYDGNVSFRVQLLKGYEAQRSSDISKHWDDVPGCENTPTTYCDFSHSIIFTGIYYLQVQAVNSHNKSPWSKMRKFEPKEDNKLGPPSVKIIASENSLNVFVAFPGESEKKPMSEYYMLTYHVWYWTNSYSRVKKKLENKRTPFEIPSLNPSTSYCLKVQAFAPVYNKSSEFSNVTCIETARGKSSYPGIHIVFIITLAVVAFIAVLTAAIYYCWRQIKYTFFPSCHPPTVIESIREKDLNSSFLVISEEPTENCVVITDHSIVKEVDLPDVTDDKELEEISQDSGNYSNDDGVSRSKESHITQEQKAV